MPRIEGMAWVDGEVKITKGNGWTETPAMVNGPFAVHPAVDESLLTDDLWTLSHVPSGLAVVRVADGGDAMKIGERLLSSLPTGTWEEWGQGSLIVSLPAWVKPWLKECAKRKEWVELTGEAT